MPLAGCLRNARLQPFAGQWVLKQSGANLMVIRTHVSRRKLTGILIAPSYLDEKGDGRLYELKPPLKQKPVRSRKLKNKSLELLVGERTDYDVIPMTLTDPNHAQLHWAKGYVPPWHFERVPDQPPLQPQIPEEKP